MVPKNPVDVNLGDGYTLKGDITEMLRINPEDMVTAITEQPGMSAYIGTLVIRARGKHRLSQAEKDGFYAKLDSQIRASKEGTKFTEKSITMEIEGSSQYQELCRAEETEAMNVSFLDNILSAFRERARMISDMAAMVRATS